MDKDEVICSCMNVTVGMIKDAIDGGARTFEEVQEATSAGTVCGICNDAVQEVIDTFLSEQPV